MKNRPPMTARIAQCFPVNPRIEATLALVLPVPLSLILLFAGCASYPMGLEKNQWEALPPAQQAEYRIRQSEIDAQNYRVAESARLQREQEERDLAERERERVVALYHRARYGDVITVSIQDGMVAFNGRRFPYEPVSFDLVRGETKSVEFSRRGQAYSTTLIEMRLSEDGNTFFFDAPARKRFVAVNESWERGREYSPPEIGSHDGHSEAIGIKIALRFRVGPELPHRFRSGRK